MAKIDRGRLITYLSEPEQSKVLISSRDEGKPTGMTRIYKGIFFRGRDTTTITISETKDTLGGISGE